MDFKTYYLNQAGNGLPFFQGSPYQRGYGLGGIFRKIFRYIMPIVREHALPVVKNVGKEFLKTAVNVASDSLNGQNVKQSAKNRFSETITNLNNQMGIHEGEGLMLKPGLSIKRKLSGRINKKSKKKRILDIFDKK